MPRTVRAVILGGLACSVLALAAAPLLMPADYSWLSMTTSESAAQGVGGAWLARLGFALFGVSVLLLAIAGRRQLGRIGALLHGAFGAAMLGTAAFSTRSWRPAAQFDATEDLLHSVAATAVGFAFALGVAATAVAARIARRHRRWLVDLLAVLASVVLPLAMVAAPAAAGALQRSMFAIAYAWYAIEVLRAWTSPGQARPVSGSGSSASSSVIRPISIR